MTPQERSALIDQLDLSFTVMPHRVKCATKHAMGAPTNNPATGNPFTSFREAIEAASDESLLILRDDFDDNGDLLPAYPEGDVVGACVCGSWPGGKCLRCPVTPNYYLWKAL